MEPNQKSPEQLANEAAGEAGAAMEQAGGAARSMSQRIMDATRSFAMEMGEALFGGDEEKGKDRR